MLEEIVAFIAILLTILSSGLALLVWSRSKREFRTSFVLLMVSQMLIMWSFFLDVRSPDIEGKLFWNNIEYLGYLLAAIFFFLFAVQYTREIKVDRKIALLLGVPAVLILLAVITNPFHHFFYLHTALSGDDYRSFVAVYGPGFYIYVAYSVVLLVGGIAALAHQFLRATNAHRVRVGVTCLASTLGVIAVLLNFIFVSTAPGGLLVSLGLLASDLLLFVGAFGFELFSMVPFGLDKVMMTARGMIFILDDSDKILFMNPAAESLVRDTGQAYRSDLIAVLPNFPKAAIAGNKAESLDIEDVHEIVPGRFFDVTVLPIHDHAGRLSGKTVTLREVTAQRAAEAEARLANHKLDLMTSITRHDVLNQLTVIEGHLSLASMKADPRAVQGHISASHQAALNIQKLLDIAREYQEMGKRMPVWQDVGQKLREAGSSLDLKGASLTVDTKGAEVLADRLLEKVLYNLIDNSIAHGEKVKHIQVVASEVGQDLRIVYSDDGVGIPTDMKPKLFTKGFGHHSGLGLYLSREILAHSGMTITEDGEPGKGARFVMTVPQGRFRNNAGLAATALADRTVETGGRPEESSIPLTAGKVPSALFDRREAVRGDINPMAKD
ncbi:MAG: hypothetical protein ISF22_01725 [Methanomassiliicoccus sp.]|nr:hypothetical protein [Methanomassiliicoccus sp.]